MLRGKHAFVSGHPLRDEFGKALSCYERALLFATQLPNPSVVIKVEELDEKTGAKKEPTSQANQLDIVDPYDYITSIYAEAFNILSKRIEEVSTSYFKLDENLTKAGVISPDRSENLIRLSRGAVFTIFLDLERDIKASSQTQGNFLFARSKEEYALDWLGLNNICRLIMEEISFISKRVDDYQNKLNAAHSRNSTNKAIRRGLIALWISTASLVVSTCFSTVNLYLHFLDKHESPKISPVSTTVSAFDPSTLNNWLSSLERKVDEDGNALAIQSGKIADLETKYAKLNPVSSDPQLENISNLKKAIDALTAKVGDKDSSLVSETQALTKVVGDLGKNVGYLKDHPLKVEVPSPKPIKTWGIIFRTDR